MEVNTQLVNNIAHLARLHFTDEEKKEIEKDLQRMISFVEKLNEIEHNGYKTFTAHEYRYKCFTRR